MSNCRLFPTNRVLDAVSVTSLGTPATGYEVANLQDADRKKRWEETGVSTATVTIQLNGSPSVDALAITGMTYSVASQFRLMANDTNSWSSPAYDSGLIDAYPASFGFGAGIFGDYAFGGFVTTAEFPYYRPVLLFVLPSTKYYEYWRLVLTDPDGGTTFGAGVIALCNMIEMPRQFKPGISISAVDTTGIRQSTAGQKKAGRPGTRYDKISIDFNHLPKEYKWFLFNELKNLGLASPFFISLFPGSGADDEVFTIWYGTLDQPPGFTQQLIDYFDMPFNFSEQP